MPRLWKLLLSFVSVLVAGCSSVPANFDLPASKDKGLVVASVRFSSDSLTPDSGTLINWAQIEFRPVDALTHFQDFGLSSRAGAVAIDGEKFTMLNVLALPPGRYRLRQVQVAGLVGPVPESPVIVIRAGRATYIGMVTIHATPGLSYRMGVTDAQGRDLPLLAKHRPGIPREAIDVELLQVK